MKIVCKLRLSKDKPLDKLANSNGRPKSQEPYALLYYILQIQLNE